MRVDLGVVFRSLVVMVIASLNNVVILHPEHESWLDEKNRVIGEPQHARNPTAPLSKCPLYAVLNPWS